MSRWGSPSISRTLRIHIAIAAVCILTIFSTLTAAAESTNQAGFLIDYGDGRITWMWMPYDGAETKVIDLLNQSDLDMVTVGFGGLGEGICQIDDTGCPAADCRRTMCQTSSSSPFWRFLKLQGNEWSFLGSGVSGTKVADGDIFALSWSAETPDLPKPTMAEIAQKAGADRAAATPVAAMQTVGASTDDNDASPYWIPSAVILVLMVAATQILILRSRNQHRKDGQRDSAG